MPADIRGLLLCGGSSTRFGSNKLLASMRNRGDLNTLVALAARNLIEGAGNALAIIPPGNQHLRRTLSMTGCDILETADTQRGLGASLAAGVAHSASADGWIVALGDMPFIQPATIALVRSKLEEGASIAAPRLAGSGQRGHPVGFSREFRDELLAVDGDEGARGVIANHREVIVLVEVDDRGIVIDIDTPGDLDAATAP